MHNDKYLANQSEPVDQENCANQSELVDQGNIKLKFMNLINIPEHDRDYEFELSEIVEMISKSINI